MLLNFSTLPTLLCRFYFIKWGYFIQIGTGVNIFANKWMSHPGKIFCVGEELLSALVVIMILLKISQPGKSWKIILPKINSLGKFCKIDSSQKFPVPEKSAKEIPSMLSWMGKYYLASKEIHFGVFSSLTT